MLNKFRYILRKNYYRCFGEYDVTMEQLKNMQKEGTTIVDVRSPLEYEEGHIEGSILIPEYELKKDIEKYLPNKDEKIILYCQTGHRSKRAQKELKQLGYSNVYNLYNGIENY